MESEHLALPLVSTQWFLNGQLVTGSGAIALGNGKSVGYAVAGDVISLNDEFQQTVEGHLRVRITDARLLSIERTISFYLAGTTKTGGSGPEAREGQVNPRAVSRYRADMDRCLKKVRNHERLLQPGDLRPVGWRRISMPVLPHWSCPRESTEHRPRGFDCRDARRSRCAGRTR